MKLMHISDLHIGKKLFETSMLEDQRYILNWILDLLDDERPDAVLIAGDVYDRANPTADAMELLDEFLNALAQRGVCTMIISGNHDSPERLAYVYPCRARTPNDYFPHIISTSVGFAKEDFEKSESLLLCKENRTRRDLNRPGVNKAAVRP